MSYIYSNPAADLGGALTGGVGQLGDTILKLAMIRNQQSQHQQDLMLQLQQLQAQKDFHTGSLGIQKEDLGLRRQHQDSQDWEQAQQMGLNTKRLALDEQTRNDTNNERVAHDQQTEALRKSEINRQKVRDSLDMHYRNMALRAAREKARMAQNPAFPMSSGLNTYRGLKSDPANEGDPVLQQLGPMLIQMLQSQSQRLGIPGAGAGTNMPTQIRKFDPATGKIR